MKNKSKILLIISILFLPLIVFADDYSSELPMFIFMEAFITLHMSAFVLSPLSKLLTPDNSKKTFIIMFMIRVIILLYFDFFVTPTIAIVDFISVFVGAFVIVPIVAAITKKSYTETYNETTTFINNYQTSEPRCQNCNAILYPNDIFCTSCGTKIITNTSIELRCSNCNNLLQPTDNFCQNCGAKIINQNINSQVQLPKTIIALSTNFDSIYSLPENQMIDEFINRELIKAEIDKNTKLIPSAILKRKNILNIILSLLIFVYTSLFFFHFPRETYIIGAIILIILFKLTRNYSLNKYLKKEMQSRPNEKISNIVMNTKNSLVTDHTNKTIIIGAIIAIALPLFIFKDPRIIYEETNGGYAVRYYIYGLTNNKTAKIPEKYNNQDVIELRGNTFSNMRQLKKVELPNTIKSIRGQAFKNCTKLEEVNIPTNLEYLGGGAFYNARSIKRIELPDTLTFLGGESFYEASSLEYIKLSESLTEIRGNTFENCTSLKSITIPDNVTRIGGHAFYGNKKLEEVIISSDSNLEEIGSSAFRQCSRLYEIKIPKNTSINERAFKESPTTIYRYHK